MKLRKIVIDYEIFLVGDEIYKIQDINFSDTIKFGLEVDTYKVYYKLENK